MYVFFFRQLHIAIIQGFIEVVFHLIQLVPKPSLLDIRNDMRQVKFIYMYILPYYIVVY